MLQKPNCYSSSNNYKLINVQLLGVRYAFCQIGKGIQQCLDSSVAIDEHVAFAESMRSQLLVTDINFQYECIAKLLV